jgi:hypothetical protein
MAKVGGPVLLLYTERPGTQLLRRGVNTVVLPSEAGGHSVSYLRPRSSGRSNIPGVGRGGEERSVLAPRVLEDASLIFLLGDVSALE